MDTTADAVTNKRSKTNVDTIREAISDIIAVPQKRKPLKIKTKPVVPEVVDAEDGGEDEDEDEADSKLLSDDDDDKNDNDDENKDNDDQSEESSLTGEDDNLEVPTPSTSNLDNWATAPRPLRDDDEDTNPATIDSRMFAGMKPITPNMKAKKMTKKEMSLDRPNVHDDWQVGLESTVDEIIATHIYPYIKWVADLEDLDDDCMGILFSKLEYNTNSETDTKFRTRMWRSLAEYTKGRIQRMRNNAASDCKKMLPGKCKSTYAGYEKFPNIKCNND